MSVYIFTHAPLATLPKGLIITPRQKKITYFFPHQQKKSWGNYDIAGLQCINFSKVTHLLNSHIQPNTQFTYPKNPSPTLLFL